MIGMIPSASSTYEVIGDFTSSDLIEGKVYYHPETKRLYFYSTTKKRSNPDTGYFPIWNGKDIFESKFSNEKYFDKDVVKPSIKKFSDNINKNVAEDVLYRQRLLENSKKLNPMINDEDNMFTQLVKGAINKLDITMVDLLDAAKGKMDQKMIENYYSSLVKVTMMRLDKFHVWMDVLLKLHYDITVYNDEKQLLKYSWPKDKFNTGIVKYTNIMRPNDDPYKKIVKILMVMENISKTSLRGDEVDDYTINNMMTTLNGNKPLSAQIFCRFIRMAKLSFDIELFDNEGKKIFEYRE